MNAAELGSLFDRVAADRPRVVLRRARLFARLHRPDELIEGESYQVDLRVPKLEILWGGKPVSVARAQLVATHVAKASEWLWGFHNASIAEVGYAHVQGALQGIPEWKEALTQRTLSLDADAALELADWIAVRAGYEAMYPARVGEATAFLGLDFTEHRGKSAQRGAPWCLGCGQLGEELKVPLVAGPEGRSLCAECARNPLDILDEKEGEQPTLVAESEVDEPADAPLADVLCAFCERRRPRLMMPETALCWVCLSTIRQTLRDK